MADLTYINRTDEVKIAGQDSTGNNVNYVGADANGNMFVKDYSDGPVTPGTVAANSLLIGGQYNSTLPTLTNTQQSAVQVDSSGRLLVVSSPLSSNTQSYSASVSALVTAASSTDIFTITGSATKTITITRIELSGTTTAGSGITISATLVKRSSVDTGGTPSALTLVPYDSNDSAATAEVNSYTANPTSLGALVGNLRANRFSVVTAGSTQSYLVWDFGNRPAQSPILRGTSQQIAINFGAASITGPLVSISIEWTES